MSGSNANYIDYMYAQWQADPGSVHASWNAYFSSDQQGFDTPPSLGLPTGDQGNDLSQLLSALKNQAGQMSGTEQARHADDLTRL